MGLLNENFQNLEKNYLFSEIEKRVEKKKSQGWSEEILSLGIGDVTLPLGKSVVSAMNKATSEMGTQEGFRGYPPGGGYSFLKEAIVKDYKKRHISLSPEEIYISDGSKSDVSGFLDLFKMGEKVTIFNPVYPVYRDSAVIKGRDVIFLEANENNEFLPTPEGNLEGRVFFLCSPNNPTGAVFNKTKLEKWVAFANRTKSILLFDGSYERFIESPDCPHSIFEIKGSKTCAVEFRSFSKTAGFTGVRCAYSVIPKELKVDGVSVGELWQRRCATMHNGVSYITQRGAEAVFTKQGQMEVESMICYYKRNAEILGDVFEKLNLCYFGGKDAPYLFLKCPYGMTSWEFFDKLLMSESVICTPGVGFGKCGEGYVRFCAFSTREKTRAAASRLYRFLKKIS